MSSDAERFRFLANHRLALHTDGGPYLINLCRTSGPRTILLNYAPILVRVMMTQCALGRADRSFRSADGGLLHVRELSTISITSKGRRQLATLSANPLSTSFRLLNLCLSSEASG
jgi:hypothetical protein